MIKHRKRRGFTIVELLVVITIIAMLSALLVPAVMKVRESARRTQCLSRANQVAKALNMYMTNKGYYPGRMSPMTTESGDTVKSDTFEGVNWVIKILPTLERNDLLDLIRINGIITKSDAVDIPILNCPSDPPPAANAPVLSFVVNSGLQDVDATKANGLLPDARANGVFHDLRDPLNRLRTNTKLQVGADYISKNDGLTNTLLLTENVDAGYWSSPYELDHGVVWNVGKQFSINSETGNRVETNYEDFRFARPSSNHSGGVNVAFCDGRAAFQSQDIDYWVYVQLLTPAGTKSMVNVQSSTRPPPEFMQPLSSSVLNP